MSRSDHEFRFEYSRKTAGVYASLGIRGTTYEIGFSEIQTLLGDISGRTFLDFGSGTGRSAEFLHVLQAKQIYALDRDQSMMTAACRSKLERVQWILGNERLPIRGSSLDGVLCTSVFIEMRTREQMSVACSEIARVLRPGGVFVLMSTNPTAFDFPYRNFRYEGREDRQSGDLARCTVTCGAERISIVDTFWKEVDYRMAIESSGLEIDNIRHPKGHFRGNWQTAESDVAPFIVIKASRKN